MNRTHRLLSAVTLFAAAPLFAQGDVDVHSFAKQLAGPAAEIEAMRAPSPVDATIHSRSALLPVRFAGSGVGGSTWQTTLPIESDTLRFLVFAPAQANWQIDMVGASGRSMEAAALAARVIGTDFGIGEARVPTVRYDFDNLQGDNWSLKLRSTADAGDGFILVEGDAATELASYQTHTRQLVGERLGLTALLTASTDADVRVGRKAGRITEAFIRVTAPDGSVSQHPMFDDGRHDDGRAGDGLFGGDFPATSAGNYVAQVEARGSNRHGRAFVRTAEHLIPVVDRSLDLISTQASAVAGEVNRLSIRVPVAAHKAGQHYRAIGEVWGTDGNDRPVAVAWLGGMVTPRNGQLALGFDERWVALSNAKPPYELRNLRIEDPDHFITVASAKRIALTMPALRTTQAASEIVIDEMMTMGPRPTGGNATQGVGKRLLLVHGYCSGGVWPASQFSTASTFLDANQNRSHDQFAQLIRNFGATWNSFGTVAHSQGGAASLHLYAFYWSGLDNATGNRLIQSVGTPYKGTNLSGILATLGSWFGIACGSNSNLTYSGASAWLAGVPNSARAKVNYYTTSFKLTNWWTNDYCQFATDLVLSDPEDGTTEQVNGQLSGGVNRGHVTGQCHTSGMRDPAQYLNASRNATMNSNAAR
ncbi:choice-of-anchor X domain-containing protein [Dokdonella sp.]|uniref:choice-of-anchor X domain-containing protein n=1 Tax=Dokdonella sp. TaxID=2291710 RepID=UPI0025C01F43|nr:choice-of-anchor X domain-containing protein [Dokdonella sp.]MBX3692840.1 conditioned medium factor [Dokdonella sp.]MCW5567946.1 conditioned medium factor [Dokdonella sp.]